MAIDEQRLRVRRSLEEKLGMEEASYLMDRPIGGWSELVTNHTLDLRFEVLDERFRQIDDRFSALEARIDDRFAAFDARFDERFRQIDDRFSAFDARFDDRFRQIDDRFSAFDARFDDRFRGLDDRFSALEHRLLAEMDRRFRAQTWATITAMFAAVGMLGAFLRL